MKTTELKIKPKRKQPATGIYYLFISTLGAL